MATKLFTQRELAKLAGVSYLTVNRALNGSSLVRPELRDRILTVAKSVGYRKNLVARSLTTKRTFALGMVGGNTPHSYWAEMLETLEQTAREANYHVVICHRSADSTIGSAWEVSFLLDRQVDGLILAPDSINENPDMFQSVADAGVPLLLLNDFVPGVQTHYLGTNSRMGARKACEYLLELGHRRICFVEGPRGVYTAGRRREGFLTAMHAAGIGTGEEMLISAGGWNREHGVDVAQRILSLSPRPTAVFAANDAIAIGISRSFRQAGVNIPQDISLMGYAGMTEGELLTPALTTVAQPVRKLGREATKLMVEIIDGKRKQPIFKELPDSLVIRESCAAPASAPIGECHV